MRLAALVLGLSTMAAAKGRPAVCKEEKPGLAAKAKIACADAEKAARAKVPGGQVKSREIEEENGRLVYSFDLRVKGKSGIEEVQVDAATGEVVSVQHESPADEAKEKAKDKRSK
jgi:uncharacterized membrane protein YkoI